MRNLLLLSSSMEGQSGYLETAVPQIQDFLAACNHPVGGNVVFVPYAGVSVSYHDYEHKVSLALSSLNLDIKSLHHFDNPQQAIKRASLIMIGGGNTFHLLHQLYQLELLGLIREKVMSGTPYIGWSAGSNIAAPSIKTTNDMPIIQPPSFHALHLLPFQINPHYLDQHPAGFHGETRQQRLEEYMVVNPDSAIVALPEGSAIKLVKDKGELTGSKPSFLFNGGQKTTLQPGAPLEELLKEPAIQF